MTTRKIPTPNLELLATIPVLGNGSHESLGHGACIMEAVSYVAGEKWSDHPACACPIISTFLRSWNDSLDQDERDVLLRPLIPELIGTRATKVIERRRAVMAGDWLIRTYTPAWLRLAGLQSQADALAQMPEITDFLQCPSLMPVLMAVRQDVSAAESAAWSAAESAARSAARSAAWSAAESAARSAAWSAAESAARSAAESALASTKLDLQQSALTLVRRMIAANASAP